MPSIAVVTVGTRLFKLSIQIRTVINSILWPISTKLHELKKSTVLLGIMSVGYSCCNPTVKALHRIHPIAVSWSKSTNKRQQVMQQVEDDNMQGE